MKFHGYFAGQPAAMQFFALLLFLLGGNLIASFLGLAIFMSVYGTQASIEQYPDMLRLFQFISAIGTFLIPSLLVAWLFHRNPKEYLHITKINDWTSVLWVLVSMLLIMPLINPTVYWNE